MGQNNFGGMDLRQNIGVATGNMFGFGGQHSGSIGQFSIPNGMDNMVGQFGNMIGQGNVARGQMGNMIGAKFV
jgi:hypothetical protein